MLLAITFTLLAVGVLVAADVRQLPRLRGAAKVAASCGFVAVGLAAGALEVGPYGLSLLGALVFSWLGDAALIGDSKRMFLLGLLLFLLGHVGFAITFALRGIDPTWLAIAALAMAAQAVLVLRWVMPSVEPSMKGPVGAYVAVICTMTALAWGSVGAHGHPVLGVAAVLFYLSDILVARERFVAPGPVNPVVGLPLYYVAQILLALAPAFDLGRPVLG